MGYYKWLKLNEYREATEELLGGADQAPVRLAAFIDKTIGPYVIKHHASSWVDDTPTNVFAIADIISVYPSVKFIHLIRNGREVAESFERLGWASGSFDRALAFWVSRVRAARSARFMVPEGNYLEIHFDDLISNPEETIQHTAAFLQIPYEEGMAARINGARAGRFTSKSSRERSMALQRVAPDLCDEYGWR
jgi:hypothetical protein